ncbi:MAG: hypothetical protein NZM06_01195 [Chloroherpetonaceae bacterium]|nr:hypothetical protein [Chloroherpetonaceae bacterium]
MPRSNSLSGASSRPKSKGFSVFQPAIALMDNLNYPVKFALISLMLVIPSLFLLILLSTVRNEAIEFAEKERLGLEYKEPIAELLFLVAEHRQAALAYFRGKDAEKAEAKQTLQALQSKIDEVVSAADAVDARLGATLESREKWADIRKLWKATKESLWQTTLEKSYADHSDKLRRSFRHHRQTRVAHRARRRRFQPRA